MPLFEGEPDPDSRRPARHGENTYRFYCQTSWPKIVRVRDFIESLYAAYPDGEHKHALSRALRKSREAFDSVFFELFLYSLLTRLGCLVEQEPVVGGGATSRPDFLVRTPGGGEFYLEAAVSNGVTDRKRQYDRVLANLYDLIDRSLKTPKFFWWIEVEQSSISQPSARVILDRLRDYASTLDWEHVLAANCSGALRASQVRIESNGWVFTFTPIAKKVDAWDNDDRPLGGFPMEGGMSQTENQIREQVFRKRKQHPNLDKPLVIAIAALQFDADHEDFMGALYGGGQHEIGSVMRVEEGVWLGPTGARKNENIPYIIGFIHLNASNVLHAGSLIYPNPFISLNPSQIVPDISRLSLQEERLIVTRGNSLGEIFELPPGWPTLGDED